jgi:3D-(3,5/4)-trihydroxycyclohexane-1,2-dione acylhydrolase (decyclizing)
MGYEIAAGLGVKMAHPGREVVVMVGDGSYQMLSSELITSIQEVLNLTVVLLDNHGFGSIGSLSESVGAEGYGTNYRYRDSKSNQLEGDWLPLDFQKNAESYGVEAQEANSYDELKEALQDAKNADKTQVIVVSVDKEQKVPGYDSWWDVQIAEHSDLDSVKKARKKYEQERGRQRNYY